MAYYINKNDIPQYFYYYVLTFAILSVLCFSCKSDKIVNQNATQDITQKTIESDTSHNAVEIVETSEEQNDILPYSPPTGWTEISNNGFMDIRYATEDNFTKQKIYDCGRCFLRKEAADALQKVADHLKTKHNYQLIIYDCYRPKPYQQKLWDVVPNSNYVTPPNKGSMHSRGLAVDLSLATDTGKSLDMGTDYDYFGKEAHHDYTNLSAEVLENRKVLKSTMEQFGFQSIRTEWWHYSLKGLSRELEGWVWECE